MEASTKTDTSILQKIKEQTRVQHDQIERNPLTSSIAEGTIDLPLYSKLLQKFYGFHHPLEAQMKVLPEWKSYNFDIQARFKTQHLVHDLRYLGLSSEAIENLEKCEDLPAVQNFAQGLGVLYVLEGSTLGGQILLRHLQKHLQLSAQQGASYFNSYGKEQLGFMWKDFQTLLLDYANQFPTQEHEIITSAKHTFHKLDHWLGQ